MIASCLQVVDKVKVLFIYIIIIIIIIIIMDIYRAPSQESPGRLQYK